MNIAIGELGGNGGVRRPGVSWPPSVSGWWSESSVRRKSPIDPLRSAARKPSRPLRRRDETVVIATLPGSLRISWKSAPACLSCNVDIFGALLSGTRMKEALAARGTGTVAKRDRLESNQQRAQVDHQDATRTLVCTTSIHAFSFRCTKGRHRCAPLSGRSEATGAQLTAADHSGLSRRREHTRHRDSHLAVIRIRCRIVGHSFLDRSQRLR